ncbi:MAG: TetR family transcriptional regulator [Leptospirales bacterium]|nr:TetR family transcriptional regulator [Leptospirales bacterium]
MSVRQATKADSGKRRQILAAALQLFSAKGYEATPVPEIAAECKIAVGGLYRYFKSKEDLANCLFQEVKTNYSAILSDGFDRIEDTREKFLHLWKAMVRFSEQRPQEFIFLEFHNHSTYLNKKSRDLDARAMRDIEQFIRRAQRRGELKKMEPALTVAIVVGIFLAYFKTRTEGQLAHPETALKQAEAAAWRAVGV